MKIKSKPIHYLLLAFCLMFFSSKVVLAQSATVDSNYVFPHYEGKVKVFKMLPVSPQSIVFIGDSLTVAGKWIDIMPKERILNRGINADISYGVYARLDEVIRHQPEKVFLMIGINDLKRRIPTQNIIRNYEKIVAKIRLESPGTTIYLNSVLPVNNTKLNKDYKAIDNADVKALNQALQRISENNKNVRFVDLRPLLTDEKGELKEQITPDGVHIDLVHYIDIVDYLKTIKAL